jgi:pseudaminic acid cytidylyltransferase
MLKDLMHGIKKRLLIIPARFGSKRIPNKNIKNFCGKPIIHYSISTAIDSGLFEEIHVSTESSDIEKVVSDVGLNIPFMRPKNLSDDHTTTIDVYKFVLSRYLDLGRRFDEVWTLLPCSPLLTKENLYEAYKLFLKHNSANPVIAVVECECHASQSFSIDEDFLSFSNSKNFKVRSQDLASRYRSAGSFGIFPAAHIINSSSDNFMNASLGYILKKSEAIDIDTNNDWELAEAIFHGKRLISNFK